MAVGNVAGNMKRGCKSRGNHTDNKKAFKTYLMKIFWIQKQIWYAHIFPEVPTNHGEQNKPAENEHQIALKIVQQKLNRKRIGNLRI
jgi:hypothetical protein